MVASLVSVGAQPVVRNLRQVEYQLLSPTDSLVLTETYSEQDPERRLTLQITHRYDPAQRKLMVVDTFRYDPATNIAYQRSTHTKDAAQNTLQRWRYLHYDADPAKHLLLWAGYYDHVGELTREDTFRYDAARRLLEKVTYRYTGSTALLAEVYRYNRRGLLRRWETWSRWYTINLAQKPVMRKARRRLYRYSYNNRGSLLQVKGTYYDETYLERNTYYPGGRTPRTKTITETVPVTTKKADKKKSERSEIVKVRYTEYNTAARPLLYRRTRNQAEEERVESTYQSDTLLLTQQFFADGKPARSVVYRYEGARRVQVVETKFNAEGQPTSVRTETSDPAIDRVVLDVLESKWPPSATPAAPVRLMRWEYDQYGHPTVLRHYINGRPFRAVYYYYEYHPHRQ